MNVILVASFQGTPIMNIFGTAGLCSAKLVLWLIQYPLICTCTYNVHVLIHLMCNDGSVLIRFRIESLIQFEFCTCTVKF